MHLVLNGALVPCYDHQILVEYREVLQRPKFEFSQNEINALLDWMEYAGRSVVPLPVDMDFADETDRKFFEVARFCHARLITGNMKHFPSDPLVVTVNEFLTHYKN